MSPRPFPIPVFGGTRCRSKDAGDDHPAKFDLQLTEEGRADLRIVDTPVPIKPVHFARK